jgi:hypothetical protein
MELFFKPFQLGITDANDSMELIDPTLCVDGLGGALPFVCKGLGYYGFGGITPLLDLGRMYLILRRYLVNGFVAFEGGKSYCCLLLRRELSSH